MYNQTRSSDSELCHVASLSVPVSLRDELSMLDLRIDMTDVNDENAINVCKDLTFNSASEHDSESSGFCDNCSEQELELSSTEARDDVSPSLPRVTVEAQTCVDETVTRADKECQTETDNVLSRNTDQTQTNCSQHREIFATIFALLTSEPKD